MEYDTRIRSSGKKRTCVAKAARSRKDGSLPLVLVKILLRRVRTGFYYQNTARWSPKVVEAFDFSQVEQAVEFVRDSRLEDVEVVLDFGIGEAQVILPLRDVQQQ